MTGREVPEDWDGEGSFEVRNAHESVVFGDGVSTPSVLEVTGPGPFSPAMNALSQLRQGLCWQAVLGKAFLFFYSKTFLRTLSLEYVDTNGNKFT